MTLNDCMKQLKHYGLADSQTEALTLMAVATNVPKTKLVAGDYRLQPKQIRRLQRLLRRRAKWPLAYIQRRCEFYGYQFYVDRRVLIPRPESEAMIDLALQRPVASTVYDVGCGSGCLGLTYARRRPQARIQLLDVSAPALRVARKNVRRFNVAHRVQLHCVDVHSLSSTYFPPGSLLLANLPYLDAAQRSAYEANCPQLQCEPAQALYTKQQGLALYDQLFTTCANLDVTIICECLPEQQPRLVDLAQRHHFVADSSSGLATLFAPTKRPPAQSTATGRPER